MKNTNLGNHIKMAYTIKPIKRKIKYKDDNYRVCIKNKGSPVAVASFSNRKDAEKWAKLWNERGM